VSRSPDEAPMRGLATAPGSRSQRASWQRATAASQQPQAQRSASVAALLRCLGFHAQLSGAWFVSSCLDWGASWYVSSCRDGGASPPADPPPLLYSPPRNTMTPTSLSPCTHPATHSVTTPNGLQILRATSSCNEYEYLDTRVLELTLGRSS